MVKCLFQLSIKLIDIIECVELPIFDQTGEVSNFERNASFERNIYFLTGTNAAPAFIGWEVLSGRRTLMISLLPFIRYAL